MLHVPLNRMESLFWTVILNKMGTLWGVLVCCLGFQWETLSQKTKIMTSEKQHLDWLLASMCICCVNDLAGLGPISFKVCLWSYLVPAYMPIGRKVRPGEDKHSSPKSYKSKTVCSGGWKALFSKIPGMLSDLMFCNRRSHGNVTRPTPGILADTCPWLQVILGHAAIYRKCKIEQRSL